MNNTLLHHFSGINDNKYLKLKKNIEEGIISIKTATSSKMVSSQLEELMSTCDYLITYVRNVVRMGYSNDEFNKELESLYSLEEKLQMIFCKIKGIDIAQNNDDPGDINDTLERYQKLMQNSENQAIADKYAKFQLMDLKQKKQYEYELLCDIYQIEDRLNELYIQTKKYQNDFARRNSYSSPLAYIAEKYDISLDAILFMKNETTRFADISQYLKKYKHNFGNLGEEGVYYILYPEKLKVNMYSFDEAMDLIEKGVSQLDKEFGNMVRQAKKESWVDWEKREGKLIGSYTNVIPYNGKSIISMSFDGSISDICKLAHELGHAYHGKCISSKKYFDTDFSVVTAEIFGLFCENYILSYLIRNIMKQDELILWKKELYFNSIRTYIVNLLAFQFENHVFEDIYEERINVSNYYDEVIKKIGLDYNSKFQRYEWMFRSQNFFPDYYYYNFVYIIGEAVSLSMLNDLLNGDLSFNLIEGMLLESGINSVDKLMKMVKQDLFDKSIYDVYGNLDKIWKFLEDEQSK